MLIKYSGTSPHLSNPDYLIIRNSSQSSEATFYYEYYYNLQDGRSLVALWQF